MKPTPLSLASAYKRLAAAIFDRALFALVIVLLFFVPTMVLVLMDKDPRVVMEIARKVPGFWILLVAWLMYCVGFETVSGATWGKKIMGCKVVGEDGKKLGVLQAFRRFWSSSFNWALLGMGFLTIFFRKDRRGLHDLVAGTYVVDAEHGEKRLRWFGKLLIIALLLFIVFVISFIISLRSAMGA
jgi:uncharacterized RDD family membrane protein YckC